MKKYIPGFILIMAMVFSSCIQDQNASLAGVETATVPEKQKVLFILTSHSEKGNTGEQTGFYLSAVCHGPAALLNIKLADGSYLIEGKTLTSFTNGEEEAVGLTEVVPFLLEDALKERGAQFIAAENWADHVLLSGRLITGQNPQSATTLGEKLLEMLQ
ncbi:MAG: type 1 glutamine amidotransferase domain-containing protein [Bacteroidales bacterium]|nr:type 1 glutamine amidotransferase domain-containing protein [Bacteroidales bacterium]